jgi:bifunctional non-homologous end joining protein LigD
MGLEEYRRKRKFTETPEPFGSARRRGRIFVVQKHDASRLHYDFRLAINRVLVSWAVPKGPSMNPAEKHLAIRTEDHPLEYAVFEGVIPDGQYGAGTVMVWDTGTYDPKGGIPPDKQLAQGRIDIVLHGMKLRGGFTLIRTGRRAPGSSNKERWLLIKHRDECADPSWDIENPRLNRSALTGRSLKEIERSREKRCSLQERAVSEQPLRFKGGRATTLLSFVDAAPAASRELGRRPGPQALSSRRPARTARAEDRATWMLRSAAAAKTRAAAISRRLDARIQCQHARELMGDWALFLRAPTAARRIGIAFVEVRYREFQLYECLA